MNNSEIKLKLFYYRLNRNRVCYIFITKSRRRKSFSNIVFSSRLQLHRLRIQYTKKLLRSSRFSSRDIAKLIPRIIIIITVVNTQGAFRYNVTETIITVCTVCTTCKKITRCKTSLAVLFANNTIQWLYCMYTKNHKI